ncbi:MAG: GNAT family N-acetyltransferase [Promethearchaeota archaeon]|jgi:hypothetical protein
MSEILKNISQKLINSFIEQNLDDFYVKSADHPNFISHIEDKISWVQSKNADWPESIFRVNFENLNIETEINNVKSLIKKEEAPNGWTVGPLTKPLNLGIYLEKSGFLNVYQQAGMAFELKNLKEEKIKETELDIEIIDNDKSLRQWLTVVSSVFGIRIEYELLEYLMAEPEVIFYVGSYKNKPVTALILFLSSGVAGLHAVSTLPEGRKKGFALDLSRTALLGAFNRGYRVGVLQASTLGEGVYRKLGFKKYSDIISYELKE